MATSPRPNSDARSLVTRGMTRLQCQLNSQLIQAVLGNFDTWRREIERSRRAAIQQVPRAARQRWLTEMEMLLDRRRPENSDARQLVDFLLSTIEDELESLQRQAVRHADFSQTFARVFQQEERTGLLLKYAHELGGKRKTLRADERALERWFSEEAVADRYQRRRGEGEQRLTFALQRLGHVLEHLVGLTAEGELYDFWQRLDVDSRVLDVLEYAGDCRVRVAALQCLSRPLQKMPPTVPQRLLEPQLRACLEGLSRNAKEDVWLQCEALSLLKQVAGELGRQIIRRRLETPQDGDDLFVRRRCVQLLADELAPTPGGNRLFHQLLQDPSDFVRQQVAWTFWQAPRDVATEALRRLARDDSAYQIRAATLAASLQHLDRRDLHEPFLHLLGEVLAGEEHEFVLRTAIYVSANWLERWFGELCSNEVPAASIERTPAAGHVVDAYRSRIVPQLRRLQETAVSIPVRRWAAESAERIWMLWDDGARTLYCQLRSHADGLRTGGRRRLPRKLLRGFDPELIGRTLAVLTQEDFGCELETGWWGYRLVKQPVFGFRWWRALYEFLHPSTDKRQAVRHTIGRISRAEIRAPSRILGELSQTKVPGEPLWMAGDGSWRPYLPLPDDFLSLLNRTVIRPRTARIYSSEGVTEMTAPRGLATRLRAAWRLTTRFPVYATARNWSEGSSAQPGEYVQALRRLGFGVRFRPHLGVDDRPVARDSSVLRFFPCLVAFLNPQLGPWLWKQLSDYAYYYGSAFENSLVHLALFASAFLLFFLGRHALANFRLRRARISIPLAMGGWGTRGKSGTERLKAALLCALGHSLVSKTTGCEAMFIQAHAFGEPVELPLFRPYDKATIWEHADLLRLAARSRPSVFLWECMGLTPEYVDVLQRQWMQDDLATITNTYPDHEDLQGPTGYDVATTIAGFVPGHSQVITTEQQMRPLLAQSCRQVQTRLKCLGWLESGLIPDDILARFPYKEHPDNIALVAAMAEELGCPYDSALKGMADFLIPDLGVLKTFPVSEICTRKIEFTNGMSANERFGTLNNWRRTGFDQHDPHEQVDVCISTVVNNRADRVARSRVFAAILVNDLEADRHVLIGSNLKGLLGLIWEAWEDHVRGFSLLDAQGAWRPHQALKTLTSVARRFRQPTADRHLQDALQRMLHAVLPADASEQSESLAAESWNLSDQLATRLADLKVDANLIADVTRHQQLRLQARREYDELATAIRQTTAITQAQQLDQRFRELLRTWFARKLVVIENSDATGEQIIHRLVQETPPGFLNRVMGLQNIKGTGLDFVYRFQAWDTCHQACELMSHFDPRNAKKGLTMLAGLPVMGQLCQARLQKELLRLRLSPRDTGSDIHALLDTVEQRLGESQAEIEQSLTTNRLNDAQPRLGLLSWMVRNLEQFLDVQDALRRRQQADQIYRDLQAERIGRRRAVEEIRVLNKRQKGGWLAHRIRPAHD